MFVTVGPGSLNLIWPPRGLLSKHPVLILGIIRYVIFFVTLGPIRSKTEAKAIHLKMVSATVSSLPR